MKHAAALLACALLVACGSLPAAELALVQISDGRPAMGTVLEITVVAVNEASARAAIERCFAEAARLELIFTTWREDGELAQLNAKAGLGTQRVSPELIGILLDARELAASTNGAFDVTVGPLVRLWRDAGARGAAPTSAEIAEALARVGIERVSVDAGGNTLALESGSSIDLGGIAKGWALDRLGELLRGYGISRALLNFGGSSLLALGRPLDAVAWRIRVGAGPVLNLRDTSVSVSEAASQFVEISGKRFGHIVDPRSGAPVGHVRRAIVVERIGASAEGWSTALVVVPPGEGVALIDARSDVEARIDSADGARYETPGFSLLAHGESAPGPEQQ